MSQIYALGNYVINPNKLDWGPGVVLDVTGSVVTVYFRDSADRPVRKIATSVVALEPAPITSDSILDNLPPYNSDIASFATKRVTHEDGLARFRSFYPLLFDDPGYFGNRTSGERMYKIEAHDAFNEHLEHDIRNELLQAGETEELSKRLFVVEGLLNLMSPYEKMALKDALKNQQAALSYFTALFDVIDQDDVDKTSFQALIAAVDDLPAEEGRARVSTWPVLTQFPYIARPDCHMFLKPEVTKSCASRMNFDLQYNAKLNWVTYLQLIKLARMLFEELKPMGAKDYIDLQSYIWTIGAY